MRRTETRERNRKSNFAGLEGGRLAGDAVKCNDCSVFSALGVEVSFSVGDGARLTHLLNCSEKGMDLSA